MILSLLAVVCLAAADPIPAPGVYGIDGVQGVLYEFPEYEDPDVALFQLSAMGAMPVLTVVEVAREPEDSPKQEDSTYHGRLTDLLKKDLDDIITLLHVARSKVEKGNTHIFAEVEKSIHYLKNAEHLLRANPSSVEDSTTQSSPSDAKDDSNNFTTEGEHSSDSQTTNSTEIPQLESTYLEKKMAAPFGDSVVITESEKYEEEGKTALRKKWTWKSSSFV